MGEDDHGDDPASATEIMFEQVVMGWIESALDFDYFAFRAEEGQNYWIIVDSYTLPDSAVGVYDSAGRKETWTDAYGDTQQSEFTWTAPSSGEYFLAMGSGDGNTGPYTFMIAIA